MSKEEPGTGGGSAPSGSADAETLLDTLAGADAERVTLERGATVGRYVVLELLGAGGMGTVHAAYDPELDRKVALKILHPRLSERGRESVGRSRLQREAQALARLSHPNVVAVHDVGSYGDQVFLAMTLNNVGVTLDELGRDAEAVEAHSRALKLRESLGDPHDLGRADALENLGNLASERGDLDEALERMEATLAIRRTRQGEDHPSTLATQLNLGTVLDQLGREDEAIELYRPVLAGFEKQLGANHPTTAVARINLGDVLIERGGLDEAEALHEQALKDLEAVLGPNGTDLSYPLLGLAEVALGRGKPGEAVPLLERGVALRESDPGGALELAKLRFALARALRGSDRDEARALARQAREGLYAVSPDHERLGDIDRFLDKP